LRGSHILACHLCKVTTRELFCEDSYSGVPKRRWPRTPLFHDVSGTLEEADDVNSTQFIR